MLVQKARISKEYLDFPTEQLTYLKDLLERSILIDQRKQAKLQWLQNPHHINRHGLQNLRRETVGMFRKK
jgi:hypothetical protein